jgi:hypothetical protein
MEQRYVYVINDEHGEPCYIGMGKGKRMHQHAKDARLGLRDRALHRYINDCAARGVVLEPYKVAEELSWENALAYEETLIAWYGRRDIGTGNLLNNCAGGVGTKVRSPASSAAMSEKIKKNQKCLDALKPYQTAEQLAKWRSTMTPEQIRAASAKGQAACVAANTGSKRTEETRAKMRKPHKMSPEGLAAISSGGGMRGKHHREDSKDRIHASNLGQKRSTETRAKMRAARLAFLSKQKGAEDV